MPQYKYDTCAESAPYDASTIPARYQINTSTMPMQYSREISTVPAQYQYNTCTLRLQNQYMFSSKCASRPKIEPKSPTLTVAPSRSGSIETKWLGRALRDCATRGCLYVQPLGSSCFRCAPRHWGAGGDSGRGWGRAGLGRASRARRRGVEHCTGTALVYDTSTALGPYRCYIVPALHCTGTALARRLSCNARRARRRGVSVAGATTPTSPNGAANPAKPGEARRTRRAQQRRASSREPRMAGARHHRDALRRAARARPGRRRQCLGIST